MRNTCSWDTKTYKRMKAMNNFDELQKMSKTNFDAAVKSFGEVNKGLQALATEMTDYSKKAMKDGTVAFEKLSSARSLEQAIEIQTEYAKKAYEDYVAELAKIGELYTGLANGAYKPVEKAMGKAVKTI